MKIKANTDTERDKKKKKKQADLLTIVFPASHSSPWIEKSPDKNVLSQ